MGNKKQYLKSKKYMSDDNEEVFFDREYPLTTKFSNQNENNMIEKLSFNSIKKMVKTFLSFNDIKVNKEAFLYFIVFFILLLTIVFSILSCQMDSLFISIFVAFFCFYCWNKGYMFVDIDDEKGVLIENIQNIGRAFLKISNFKRIYLNAENILGISTIFIVINFIIEEIILFTDKPLNVSFLNQVAMPVILSIYFICAVVSFFKDDLEYVKNTSLVISIINVFNYVFTCIVLLIRIGNFYFMFNYLICSIIFFTIYIICKHFLKYKR